MKRKFKAVPGRGIVASTSIDDSVQQVTVRQAYDQDNIDGMYDSIDDYAYDYFEMPASSIKMLYGLWDGSNEDTGIETKDGRYFIAYSGHGVWEVDSKQEMLAHFQ